MVGEGRLIIPLACWLATGVMFGMEMFLYAKAFRAPTLYSFEVNCRWMIMTVLCLSATVDTLEAFSLFYYMNRLRSQSLRRYGSFELQ